MCALSLGLSPLFELSYVTILPVCSQLSTFAATKIPKFNKLNLPAATTPVEITPMFPASFLRLF